MDLIDKKIISRINYKKALVFIVTHQFKDKSYHGKIKKFSGYQTFAWIKVADFQNLYIKAQITEGQAAVIAIQKKEMLIITKDDTEKHVTLPFKKGYIRLRLAGNQANLNFIIKKA